MAIIPVEQLPDAPQESQQSNGSDVLSSLLSNINLNQVAYSIAGGTAPQDIGGALANKITGQNSGIGGVAPQAEDMRQSSINTTTQDPLSRIALSIVTDPMTYVGLGASKEAIGGVIASEGRLQKAAKGKEALDTLRSTLGKAKELAIKEVADVPVKLDLRGISNKVIKAIEDPIYGIAKESDGSLVNSISNMDKVKEAVGELINTPKIWEEAPKKELRVVKQLYGQINNAMKSAARSVGKPIDEALDAYSKFMDNYHLMNPTLVDSAGNAMGNKLRNAFRVGAEPAVKQAWAEISKSSPEIKKIMGTMKQREIIKNLLKVGGYGGGGAYVAHKLSSIAGSMAGNGTVSYDEGQ
jgi:hypothetical protein